EIVAAASDVRECEGGADPRNSSLHRYVEFVHLHWLDVHYCGGNGWRDKVRRVGRKCRLPALIRGPRERDVLIRPVRWPDDRRSRGVSEIARCEDAIPAAHDERVLTERTPCDAQARRHIARCVEETTGHTGLSGRHPERASRGTIKRCYGLSRQVHFAALVL